ncbi:MAG: helix-turn-helix domain-containing GNAT family N-acetyltransferase [Spirosomaceae bacterium]|nr:helix-turn-helix domain-containing GNAT family N-acetyltransferase [Spirosomataceae bacterium]
MNFYNDIGPIAIGSRLRMLSELITENAREIYKLYDVALETHWFPVFYALSKGQEKSITALAEEVGQSHPAVIKTLKQMAAADFIQERKDEADGRKNLIRLSEKGKETALKIESQYTDVGSAIEEINAQSNHDLWRAIGEWEFLLQHKSLFRRTQEHRKRRESQEVQIVAYEPQYQKAFRDLNEEWISQYFKMEEPDYRSLDNPQGYILDQGGHIFVALHQGEPVGVCALIKMNDPDYDYELAKMAVSPKAQGKSIGWLLGQAVIHKAKALGARKLFLESNTVLAPAINLYHKLGFVKVGNRPSPYERADIQMELTV